MTCSICQSRDFCDKYLSELREIHQDAWSITVILERYIVPKRQDPTVGDDKFFDDF